MEVTMTDPTLVTTLRLLFDGKEPAEIAKAFNEAIRGEWPVVEKVLKEQHTYGIFYTYPDWFTEYLENSDEVFVGPRQELEDAAFYVRESFNQDSFYDYMGDLRDEHIERWRAQ